MKFMPTVPKDFHDIINGNYLPASDKVKLLGVTIDCKLNFNSHVENLCKRSNQKINALLKGNEALEKKIFFFFSKARKYGEEIKIKKRIKIPLFPASQTTF